MKCRGDAEFGGEFFDVFFFRFVFSTFAELLQGTWAKKGPRRYDDDGAPWQHRVSPRCDPICELIWRHLLHLCQWPLSGIHHIFVRGWRHCHRPCSLACRRPPSLSAWRRKSPCGWPWAQHPGGPWDWTCCHRCLWRRVCCGEPGALGKRRVVGWDLALDFLVYPWLWRGSRRHRRRCLGLCLLGGLDRGSVLGMGSRRMGELKGCCGPWWAGTREVRGCVAYIYDIFITLTNTCSSSSPPPSSSAPSPPHRSMAKIPLKGL